MKKHTRFIFLFIVTISVIFSCQKSNTFSIEAETKALLKLHNNQRDFHFKKDSIAFANQLSEHFISVNRGDITTPSKQETTSRYHDYFSSVEFVKWDDVSEPIIKFSDDGSMAYTIVDKIVTVSYKDSIGNTLEDETHFAWTAIYKKHGDEWKIDCVTSTNKPTIPVTGSDASNCIATIIKQDSILGKVRNDASKKMSLSHTINAYAESLLALDYRNCPEAFAFAFKNHIDAWLDVKRITDKYPSLRGELHDVFDQLEQTKDSTAFKLLVKKVWDTWATVETHSKS